MLRHPAMTLPRAFEDLPEIRLSLYAFSLQADLGQPRITAKLMGLELMRPRPPVEVNLLENLSQGPVSPSCTRCDPGSLETSETKDKTQCQSFAPKHSLSPISLEFQISGPPESSATEQVPG